MKGIIVFVTVIILLVLAIVIGSQNTQMISVNYLIAKAQMRMSTFMVITISLGFVIGLLVMLLKYVSARMHNKILLRRLKKLSKEAQ